MSKQILVRIPFRADGLERRQGEILPFRGANITDLLKIGQADLLDPELEEEVVICTEKGCDRQFLGMEAMEAHISIDHDKTKPAPPVGPPPAAEVVGPEPKGGPDAVSKGEFQEVGRPTKRQ